MFATVIETKDLLSTIVASLAAGVGVTAAFSVLVFGATRSADLVRAERPVLAAAAGALAVVGAAIVIGAIVLGIVVMSTK